MSITASRIENLPKSSYVSRRAGKLALDTGLAVVSQTGKIAHELEARYWACIAFIEQYPVSGIPEGPEGNDARHDIAMQFALDGKAART